MNDLHFAFRTLLRNPSFTIAAILALALGIGATTAIFSVVDAVLLRPLPYPDGDRLVSVSTKFPGQDSYFVASWDYLEWSRDNKVFDAYAAMGRVWEEPLALAEARLACAPPALRRIFLTCSKCLRCWGADSFPATRVPTSPGRSSFPTRCGNRDLHRTRTFSKNQFVLMEPHARSPGFFRRFHLSIEPPS